MNIRFSTISTRCVYLLLFVSTFAKAQNGCWVLQYPKFPTEYIRDFTFSTPTDAYVVGAGGLIGRSTDGGYNWTPLPYATYNELHGVHFPTPQVGYAVGFDGTVVKSGNNGFTWGPLVLQDSVLLRCVHFLNNDTGFVAGDSCILKTTNGGQSWTRQAFSFPSSPNNSFTYIRQFSADTVVAYNIAGKVFRSVDGGSTWVQYSTTLHNVSFATANIGWGTMSVVNGSQVYKTTNGGATWALQANIAYPGGGAGPDDIQALDTAQAVVLSFGSQVHKTINGGQTWTLAAGYISSYLYAICFQSINKGLVGGLWGQLFMTANSGANWTVATNNEPDHMERISVIDSNNVFVGGGHKVWRTRNGGTTWSLLPVIPGNGICEDMQFIDTLTGWIGTNWGLMKTINGGQTWNSVTISSSVFYQVKDMRFYNATFGVVALNQGRLAVTHNGGTTWTITQVTQTLYEGMMVGFLDSLHWYVSFNYGNTFKSSDAGQTWTNVVYTPGIVTDWHFWDTSKYYIIDNDFYRTSNGGASWATSGLNFSAMRMSFTDSLKGYITKSYLSGNAYLEPKLMKTINGGLTWANVPIHSGVSYNDVSFIDSSRGWLCTNFGCIYRYYEDCPPTLSPPFLNTNALAVCTNSQVTVSLVNSLLYNTPYDTIVAYVKQGNTILQTLSLQPNGTFTFTAPANAGTNYSFTVKVSSPGVPSGHSHTIPLTVQSPGVTPYVWFATLGSNPVCTTASIGIQLYNTSAYGAGYSFELHKLTATSDSIVTTTQLTTTFSGLTDSFQLYFKVTMGNLPCHAGTIHYSDTFDVNVIAPYSASVFAGSWLDSVCVGTPFDIGASAFNAGTGVQYEFHKLQNGTDSILQTGPSGIMTIPALYATADFYVVITPGFGDCHNGLPAISDTFTVSTYPAASFAGDLSSDKPFDQMCTGEMVTFTAVQSSAPVDSFYFYRYSAGAETLIGAGYANVISTTNITDGDLVYAKMVVLPFYCFANSYTDTVIMTVTNMPAAPAISSSGLQLTASNTPGATYNWELDGNLIPGANTNTWTASSIGNYRVRAIVNGCAGPWSSNFYVATLGVEGVAGVLPDILPNPATDMITIRFDRRMDRIMITDAIGKKVAQWEVPGTYVIERSVADLSAGVYTVTVICGERRWHTKFVKK